MSVRTPQLQPPLPDGSRQQSPGTPEMPSPPVSTKLFRPTGAASFTYSAAKQKTHSSHVSSRTPFSRTAATIASTFPSNNNNTTTSSFSTAAATAAATTSSTTFAPGSTADVRSHVRPAVGSFSSSAAASSTRSPCISSSVVDTFSSPVNSPVLPQLQSGTPLLGVRHWKTPLTVRGKPLLSAQWSRSRASSSMAPCALGGGDGAADSDSECEGHMSGRPHREPPADAENQLAGGYFNVTADSQHGFATPRADSKAVRCTTAGVDRRAASRGVEHSTATVIRARCVVACGGLAERAAASPLLASPEFPSPPRSVQVQRSRSAFVRATTTTAAASRRTERAPRARDVLEHGEQREHGSAQPPQDRREQLHTPISRPLHRLQQQVSPCTPAPHTPTPPSPPNTVEFLNARRRISEQQLSEAAAAAQEGAIAVGSAVGEGSGAAQVALQQHEEDGSAVTAGDTAAAAAVFSPALASQRSQLYYDDDPFSPLPYDEELSEIDPHVLDLTGAPLVAGTRNRLLAESGISMEDSDCLFDDEHDDHDSETDATDYYAGALDDDCTGTTTTAIINSLIGLSTNDVDQLSVRPTGYVSTPTKSSSHSSR